MQERSNHDSRPLYREYGKTCFGVPVTFTFNSTRHPFFPIYPEFDICRHILFLESGLEFHLNSGTGWSTAFFPSVRIPPFQRRYFTAYKCKNWFKVSIDLLREIRSYIPE